MAIFSNFSDPTHPFLEVFHAVNLLCTLRPRASDKGPTSKLPNLLIGWEMCLAARRLIGFLCVACTGEISCCGSLFDVEHPRG